MFQIVPREVTLKKGYRKTFTVTIICERFKYRAINTLTDNIRYVLELMYVGALNIPSSYTKTVDTGLVFDRLLSSLLDATN